MYKVITHKDGTKDIKPPADETPAGRTERLKLKAILNGLFTYVHPGFYRVRSTKGSTTYDVRWVRALRAWGCTCEGYSRYCYKFPACPCIHVACVLLDIGDEPAARSVAEMVKRKGDAIYAFAGTYTGA